MSALPSKILHLHVKSEYFEQIQSGEKRYEYRELSPYWCNRLINDEGKDREYKEIIIYNAYKSGLQNRLHFPWRGFKTETITHPHFGEDPVKVFAIPLRPS